MSKTSTETARSIARMAAQAFAGHVLTQEGAHWRCGRPGSSTYASRVYAPPGAVIVWGDIGELTLIHSDGDSIGWLARAAADADYPDYCLGKITAIAGAKREFFVGDAKAYLRERLRETVDDLGDVDQHDRDRWSKIALDFRDRLDDREDERAAWHSAYAYPDDPPDCEGWSSRALWIWHGLVTFVRLYQAPVMGELAAHNLATAYHPHRSLAS